MPYLSSRSRDELLSAIRAHIQHDHLEHAAQTLDRFEPAQAHYYWLPVWQRLNALLEAWPDDEREVPVALCEHQVLKWPVDARDESGWLTQDKLRGLDPRLRLLGQVRINAMHLAQDQLRLEHPEALPHVHALYINGQLQPEQLAKLLNAPLSAQITSLHLEHVPLTLGHIEALISSPLRLRLDTLSGSHNKLSEEAMRRLGSASWPALRELNLRDGRINDRSLSALFMSENMPALRALGLPQNALSDLATLKHLELESLSLENNPGGIPLIKSLVSLPHLERLEHLNLSATLLGDLGLKLLLKPQRLGELRSLHLQNNHRKPLTQQSVDALLGSKPTKLAHLNLSHSAITWQGLATLLSSPHMSTLHTLQAAQCPNLDISAATPLTHATISAPLQRISLDHCKVSDPALAASCLASIPWPKTISTLSLSGVTIAPHMIEALGQHPHLLQHLRTLTLHGASLQAEHIEALCVLSMPALERLLINAYDRSVSRASATSLSQAPWFSQLLHLSVTLTQEGRDALQPHLERHGVICWD